MAYLITFKCYGSHLPGNEQGWVDRNHKRYGDPFLEPCKTLERLSRNALGEKPYKLDKPRRNVVLEAIQEACRVQDWLLIAAHVRSTHVPSVFSADCRPEPIRQLLKKRSSEKLAQSGLDGLGKKKRWVAKGSRRYLWEPEQVAAAVEYVLYFQGPPMARCLNESWPQLLQARMQKRADNIKRQPKEPLSDAHLHVSATTDDSE